MPAIVPARMSVFVALLALQLLSVGVACGQEEPPAALVAQAKANFQPVSSSEVDQAQTELEQAAKELERFLRPGSRKSEAWHGYLKWSNVRAALEDPNGRNLAALRDTLDRLRSGANGLEMPPFRRAAAAIERYLDLASIARASDQQAAVAQQLDLLAGYLERYENEPSPRVRYEIERRLDFFSGIGRAPELVSAVGRRFQYTNIRSQMSERMLDRIVAEPVDDIGPVRDCILGTTIRGTGRTTGMVTIQTLPSPQRATLLLQLAGTTSSNTVGYNSPVVIRSTGATRFTATKRVDLEDDNFWNYPARVSATTTTQTRSVQKQGGGLGSRLISSIGARQVAEKKPRADYIAARHAEERIAREFNEEILPRLQDLRYEYLEGFRKPLELRDAAPAAVAFSTTDRSLNLDVLQARRGQLGAGTPPPPTALHDVAVQAHETGAANLASAFVSGATLSQRTREGDPHLNVELPQRIQEALDRAGEDADDDAAEDEGEFKPWSVRFRRLRPVSFEFADNQVKLRIHATRITTGNDTYDDWDILIDYALQPQDGELKLVRQGEIEVIPTAFDPAEGGGLTNRQVALRGNLARELNRQSDAGRGFPQEIDFGMLDLPGELAKYGPLLVEQASADAGWLLLGWRLP